MCDEPGGENLVSEEHLSRALKWCKYLRTHANRLYAAAVIPETAGAESLLRKIIGRKLCDSDNLPLTSFTPRQVANKGWTGLNNVELVRSAADLLADYDWLRRDTVYAGGSGGRHSDRYLINPAALRAADWDDREPEKFPD
jgi:putative DNA primase/helicase